MFLQRQRVKTVKTAISAGMHELGLSGVVARLYGVAGGAQEANESC